MLGLSKKSTYEQWTALFNPTSTYEGNWEKGSKILFIGFDETGQKGGMVSEVIANIKNSFVSVKHYGIVKGVYRDWETDRKSTRLNSSHRL